MRSEDTMNTGLQIVHAVQTVNDFPCGSIFYNINYARIAENYQGWLKKKFIP